MEKKIITTDYSQVNLSKIPNVNFDIDRFDNAIIQKGYNVLHEKALRCPCFNKQNGSSLPNCYNCGGVGYFYIEKKETRMLMMNLGNNKKYENWSETNSGTTTITSLFDDDISYMDKITNVDLLGNFSQAIFPKPYNDKLFAFTIYEPIEVFSVYKFLDSNSPLLLLKNKADYSDWDYEIIKNRLELNVGKFTYEEDLTLSIRYKHHPVYAIIDIVRELFKAKQVSCSTECGDDNSLTALRGMPMRSVGRKFHYLFDAANMDGNYILDNTDYTKFPGRL